MADENAQLQRTMDNLSVVLTDLARKIDYMTEVTRDLARSGGKGNSASMPFNMNYDAARGDIFRNFVNERNASNNDKRAYEERKNQLREKNNARRSEINNIPRERERLEREKRQLEARLTSLNNKLSRGEIDSDTYDNERESIESDLTKAIEKLNNNMTKRSRLEREIADTEREIAQTFDELQNEMRQKAVQAAWDNMTQSQKNRYGDSIDNFRVAKEAQHQFNIRYDERQEASRLIQNSGFENTAVAKIAQRAINRNQKYDNMTEFGRKLRDEGGAADIANAMFGKNSNLAKKATGALGKFGGAAMKWGNFLTKSISPIMVAVDAIRMLGKAAGEAANEWKKQTADFIKFQTEQENLRYEQAKQHLVLENQMEIEMISYRGDMSLKKMDMYTENMIEALEIANERYIKSMEIGTGAITAGVAQNAYNAAEASIDAAAKLSKANLHRETRAMEYGIYGEKRGLEAEGKIAGLQADIRTADVTADIAAKKSAMQLRQGQLDRMAKIGLSVGGVMNGVNAMRDVNNNTTTGAYGEGRENEISGQTTQLQDYKGAGLDQMGVEGGMWGAAALGIVGAGREGYRAEQEAKLENQTEHMRRAVDAIKTKTDVYYNKANVEMQYQTEAAQKGVEYAQKQAEMVIDAAVAVEKNWLKVTQTVENWLRKFDERMNDLALNVGMWGQDMMSNFKEAQLQTVKEIALKYGKSYEEIAKYQNAYTEQSGRNKLMSQTDIDKAAALGTLIGDDSMAAKYAGEMEFFNKNAEQSVDLIYEEMKAVNKVGLNARKYIKDVTDNLKLANKYNFKEGTKSLREMVKWAQQTKFNMQSLGAMLEKVQEGGIEGVITQSAGFQVLGGMAAINSDPLGMLYDAWADPQAYAKRMQDMTKGFGTFNKKTGETEFNMPESMQIAQIAKLQGRSPEELREEIARRNQMNHVKASLSNEQKRTLTKDQQDLIANKANFNQETGQWQINTLQNGKITPVDIADITKDNIDKLTMISNDHNEKIEQMVGELVSIVSKETGEQTFEQADLAARDYRNTMEDFHKRLKLMHDSYIKNSEDMLNNIKVQQDNITKNTKSYLDDFATNIKNDTSAISAETDKIRAMTNDIGAALGSISVVVTAAAQGIQEALQQKLGQELGVRNIESVVSGATGTVNAKAQTTSAAASGGYSDKAKSIVQSYLSSNSKEDLQKYVSNYEAYVKGNNGNNNEKFYKEVLSKGVLGYGWMNKIQNSVMKNKSSWRDKSIWKDLKDELTPEQLNELLDAIYNEAKVASTGDAITSANGKPMMISASNITPIRDGMAKSSINDGALVAEKGGPFDTLFNRVFKKIDTVYDTVFDERQGGGIRQAIESASRVYHGDGGGTSTVSQTRDINVNIGGTLRLDTGNQQVNLIDLLNQNPDLVRRVTEMIINEFSKTENGGKYKMYTERYYR